MLVQIFRKDNTINDSVVFEKIEILERKLRRGNCYVFTPKLIACGNKCLFVKTNNLSPQHTCSVA